MSLRNELKATEKKLEEKTKQKKDSLSEEEAKELLLEKFHNLIDEQLNKYLNAEKKEIVKIFENLWDKYKISLKELIQEKDMEVKKLDEFLTKLWYYNG